MVTAVSKVVAQSQRSHSEVKVTPPHLAGDAGHVKRRPEEVAGGGVRGEVDPRDDLAPANRARQNKTTKQEGGRKKRHIGLQAQRGPIGIHMCTRAPR